MSWMSNLNNYMLCILEYRLSETLGVQSLRLFLFFSTCMFVCLLFLVGRRWRIFILELMNVCCVSVFRYTLIWVTDLDYKDNAYQNYWRQSALANLVEAHPSPTGKERILLVLTGISEEEFYEANQEFMPFVRI